VTVEPIATLRDTLLRRIDTYEASIGIIGQGYVGVPLALTFAEKGFRVLGFDVDPDKVAALNRGECYIRHVDALRVKRAREKKLFEATADFTRLREPDAILICVPTPLTAQKEPDLTYVRQTAEAIRLHLRRGQLIVLESTTYPGTTDELVRDVLEQGGLKAGVDFFLAFSPEREDPGNKSHSTPTIPKVVGGIDMMSGDVAQRLYDAAVAKTVRVSSARAAEATKLTENIFRAVNIALVNELKIVYDKMGIDIWEVLDAASTKPFGFMRFNPGPGWGGHCIPLDPFYLAWKAREYGVSTKFIELAGEVNVRMPEYVVGKLQEALNECGRAVKGAKILVLGLAYKKDIDDPRESPAFEVIHELLKLGADVSYHDPYVPVAPKMRSWPNLPAMMSRPLTPEVLRSADAALLITDHTSVDYDLILKNAPLIVDTRGIYRLPASHVVKA
jgi:UDP-N-acetyl-D-glucosamine dehydrogenase